jgi:hypothetical protein
LPARISRENWGGGRIELNKPKILSENEITLNFHLKALDYIKEITSKRIGLIKIDVEGHELHALKGMTKIISRRKPVIVFEQHGGINNGTSHVVELLRSLGYKKLYEVQRKQQWFFPNTPYKPINSIIRIVETLFFGYPVKKCELILVNSLRKNTYDMLLMTQ